MKIIALQGPQNSGKTTAINELYDLLIKDSSTYMLEEDKFSFYQEQKKQPLAKDFFAIFKRGDITIGVSSYGDTSELIERSFDYFKKQNCDVSITACLTSGRTYNSVINFDQKAHFIRKYKEKNSTLYSVKNKDAAIQIKKVLDSF